MLQYILKLPLLPLCPGNHAEDWRLRGLKLLTNSPTPEINVFRVEQKGQFHEFSFKKIIFKQFKHDANVLLW